MKIDCIGCELKQTNKQKIININSINKNIFHSHFTDKLLNRIERKSLTRDNNNKITNNSSKRITLFFFCFLSQWTVGEEKKKENEI